MTDGRCDDSNSRPGRRFRRPGLLRLLVGMVLLAASAPASEFSGVAGLQERPPPSRSSQEGSRREPACDLGSIPDSSDFDRLAEGNQFFTADIEQGALEDRLLRVLDARGFRIEKGAHPDTFQCETSFVRLGTYGRGDAEGFVALQVMFVRDQGSNPGMDYVVRFIACEKRKVSNDARPPETLAILDAAHTYVRGVAADVDEEQR